MRRTRTGSAKIIGGALLFIVAAAASAQMNPPSWWLANDGVTTSQGWTFDNTTNPLDPDFFVNPFGPPSASTNGTYLPTFGGRNGLIDVHNGEEIAWDIPNHENRDFIKKCWWQITYFGGGAPFRIETSPGSNVQNFDGSNVDFHADGSLTWTVTFDIVPQPQWERIVFGSSGNAGHTIDSFYFGSHCIVPEPATLATLGLGAVALLRRRRKA